MKLINERMDIVKEKIISDLRNNPIVYDFNEDITDSYVPYISCKLDTVTTEDFYRFIQVFTTKHFSYFGKSLNSYVQVSSSLEITTCYFKNFILIF